MTRKGDTVLVAALKRYSNTMKKYIQDCLHKDMKVKLLIEDARDSQGKASGAAYLEIAVDKKGGWGEENQVEIHGTIGFDKAGKKGKKEDEAYLDGVTVGDWDEGSKAIGLNGCSIGEFLVHMFTLFAIKAGNESVLLDNAAGPRGEHIYRQVGFIKSKGDRAQYGDDNEMIFPLTGKKKNKDAGQLWRERYNKFRKKLAIKIKNSANCKTFWKCVPPALEAPGPVHMLARGSRRRTRKKRGGYGPGITPEQARRMSRRDDRRREDQRRLQIQQELARSELNAAGPGDSVTNQPIEETEKSKALKKMAENNQKIIANKKKRKVEEPKKFTEEELSQIQFEPTDLKKNQIGIVNPDGSLAVASKIKVPFRKRMLRDITQKIRKKLAQRKRKTRVAPAPRVGGKKTKRRRTKRTRKRKIPTNTVENIWGKNKKLEKFWRKLASGREVILVNKNDEKTNYKLPKTHPALGNKYRELEEDDNIKAIITSAQSSDIYESLYKRVKNKTPKEIINNYKKYLIKDGKTWYL
jgi:hypothetical protein